jgi:hypothetical protein
VKRAAVAIMLWSRALVADNVVTAEQASRVATERTAQDLAGESAGVVNGSIKGGNALMNRWYVDGVEVTDPVDAQLAAPINFESLDAVSVLTTMKEAQYNALGGVISVHTDDGDRLRLGSSLYASSATLPEYQANLVAAGAPLDRLWLSAAVEYDHGAREVPLPWFGARQRTFDDYLGRLKLTFVPRRRQRVTLSATASRDRGLFSFGRWRYDATEHVGAAAQIGVVSTGPDTDRRLDVSFDPSLSLRGHFLGEHDALVGVQTRIAHQSLVRAAHDGFAVGAFVQDRWRPWPRLVLLPGVRVDWGYAGTSLVAVGPRVGARYYITADRKTLASAFVGRSTETMSLLPMQYRIAPVTVAPHADELSFALSRDIQHGSWISIEYTYKRIANIWQRTEINQIWDPAGARVVGYVDGNPRPIYVAATPDANYRLYHGVDFSVVSQSIRYFDIYFAYTLAFNYGPGAGELGVSAYDNPRLSFLYDGWLPEDVRHALKLRASYARGGFLVGGYFHYLSGAPIRRGFDARAEGQAGADARVAYTVGGLQLICDVFNHFGPGYQSFRFQIGLRYTYGP